MADYSPSEVPNEALESAIGPASEAIRILLAARMPRPWIAAFAGKLIDYIGDELDEEKRKAEAKATAEAAREKTALGKLLAREEQRRWRARQRGNKGSGAGHQD